MAKQSGMMAFAEQYAQKKVEAAQRLILQYAIDTLQIAIHQTEGWGYDRILRLSAAWFDVRHEYSAMMNPADPGADVAQEHMDRVLAEIIRDKQKLIPFERRYPDLKKHKTGKF